MTLEKTIVETEMKMLEEDQTKQLFFAIDCGPSGSHYQFLCQGLSRTLIRKFFLIFES